mmetsp:Transcript_41400/g.46755  ORF Transcript_41400/g.46755 Transcript_41400/m.46755 type:complete len:130 (+) Transcript_41400:3-392(+)
MSSRANPPLPPPPTTAYSPSFLERKTTFNPAHFSATPNNRSSLFWSLQTDSNIGSCDGYKPALVETSATTTAIMTPATIATTTTTYASTPNNNINPSFPPPPPPPPRLLRLRLLFLPTTKMIFIIVPIL